MRNRILRLRHRIIWKGRRLRGRAAYIFIGAKEALSTFSRIATLRPIMGGSPEGDPPPADPKPADPPKPKADPPPQNQLGEQERLRKKAEKEAREAQQKLDELEGRDQSEIEKAEKARLKAEQEATEAKDKAMRLERGGWVRTAASTAGAIDTDAVVALVDLGQAETAETAEQLVKELAEKKPGLFGQRPGSGGGNGGNPPGPAGFGTPAGGSPAGGGSPEGGLPGISESGEVDKGEVRKQIGGGLLGLIRGKQASGDLPGGGNDPGDDED